MESVPSGVFDTFGRTDVRRAQPMQGTWIGTYKYDSKNHSGLNKRVIGFTIVITDFDGINFQGTVTDDLESGGTKGEGVITGIIQNNKIEFVKQMPVLTLTNRKGRRIEAP